MISQAHRKTTSRISSQCFIAIGAQIRWSSNHSGTIQPCKMEAPNISRLHAKRCSSLCYLCSQAPDPRIKHRWQPVEPFLGQQASPSWHHRENPSGVRGFPRWKFWQSIALENMLFLEPSDNFRKSRTNHQPTWLTLPYDMIIWWWITIFLYQKKTWGDP